MDWVCPDDRRALLPRDGKLGCAGCGRDYALADGIPLFARDEKESARLRRPVPLLDELRELMRHRTGDEAERIFCERYRCSSGRRRADWRLFFAAPPGQPTLEIGGGTGTPPNDENTIGVVPTLSQALLQRERLEGTDRTPLIAVTNDLKRLPLGDRAVGAVVMEDLSVSGFDLSGRSLAATAAEWRRILIPGGAVFLGSSNRIRAPRSGSEPLDRLLRRAAGNGSPRGPGLRRAIRAMKRQGFRDPLIHAALPDEMEAEVLLPIDDPKRLRYFLDNLVRKNSMPLRAALRIAGVLAGLGLYRYVVPYRYLLFESEGS